MLGSKHSDPWEMQINRFCVKHARDNILIGFYPYVIPTEILAQGLHPTQAVVAALVGIVQVAEVKNEKH